MFIKVKMEQSFYEIIKSIAKEMYSVLKWEMFDVDQERHVDKCYIVTDGLKRRGLAKKLNI